MFKNTKAFSSYSVDDLPTAKDFYGKTLGLSVTETPEGLILKFADGGSVFVYPKPHHQPATHTVLNFQVDDVDKAVDELRGAGVKIERFEGIAADDNGISRGKGPTIAWFKDPAGNILSVLQVQ